MSRSLTDFTDAELRMEVQRRAAVQNGKINEHRERQRGLTEKFIDTLLLLVPEHDRTSCSDENPCNPGGGGHPARCIRCALLRVKREGYSDLFVSSVSVEYATDPLPTSPDDIHVIIK